jgi:hypothetical protein
MNDQWHFEFKDWEAAFELFFRQKKENNTLCFVISSASYVSGHWIEKNAYANKQTRVYRTVRAVRALEKRVRAERGGRISLALRRLIV